MNNKIKLLELEDIPTKEDIYTQEDVEEIMGLAANFQINFPTKREVEKLIHDIKVNKEVLYNIGKKLEISKKHINQAIKHLKPRLEEQVEDIYRYDINPKRISSEKVYREYKKVLYPIFDNSIYGNNWTHTKWDYGEDIELNLDKTEKVRFLGIFSRIKKNPLMKLKIQYYADSVFIKIYEPEVSRICGNELKKIKHRLKEYFKQEITSVYMDELEFDETMKKEGKKK